MESWAESAERVVVHTSHYLDVDGTERRGGRGRLLTELLRLARRALDRPVVVVQKGAAAFETTDPDGVPVIGLPAPEGARGDAALGRGVRRLLRDGDVVLYGSGAQGAFPFFVRGAKGVQHGIGWDGPYSLAHRRYHDTVNLAFANAARSILCVDTNYINWLRTHGARGLELAARCVYAPNFADLDHIDPGDPARAPGDPLRLVWARRNEAKRGPDLFLDALVGLRRRGVAFEATMFAVGDHAALHDAIAARGLVREVDVRSAGMTEILGEYAAFDVAVVPTRWSEGTSLACVEAICAGLPVVTTPVGGLGNLVIPGFNGEIVAPDASAMADAIAAYAWRCAPPSGSTRGRPASRHGFAGSASAAVSPIRPRSRHLPLEHGGPRESTGNTERSTPAPASAEVAALARWVKQATRRCRRRWGQRPRRPYPSHTTHGVRQGKP